MLGGAGALSYGRCVERLLRPARAGGAKTRSHPDEATRTGWCDRWYRLRDILYKGDRHMFWLRLPYKLTCGAGMLLNDV